MLHSKRISENNIYDLRTDEKKPLRGETDGKMEIFEEFYKELFTREKICKIYQSRLLSNIWVNITDEQRDYLDNFIDENELRKALRDTPTNKRPGLNGLTKEFWELFWNDINDIKAAYMEVFCEILTKKNSVKQWKLQS